MFPRALLATLHVSCIIVLLVTECILKLNNQPRPHHNNASDNLRNHPTHGRLSFIYGKYFESLHISMFISDLKLANVFSGVG